MNSDEIRSVLFEDGSSDSELSIFQNLGDSDDPSVNSDDLDYGSDSDGQQPNLDNMEIDDELPEENIPQPDQNQVDDADEIQVTKNGDVIIWSDMEGNLNNFNFLPAERPGISEATDLHLLKNSPFEFYSLFLDNEILDLLVTETNRYAEQRIVDAIARENVRPIYLNWYDTSRDEMLTFIGVVLWMGLDRKPKLRNYWCKNEMYSSVLSKTISRNRFEAILSFLHVSNNETALPDDRLAKINPLVRALTVKFQNAINPGENICIDESMVPFRGRVHFRQYIQTKKHRYGIKIFKLCLKGGYTWRLKIYAGKQYIPRGESASALTVMELIQPLLNAGRTLFTDNYYTSVQLAHSLNENETHLIGTLRKNRVMNSKIVADSKLEKGQMVVKESNTGVIMGKWKDKREVTFLTTKSVPQMIETTNKRGDKRMKPSTILEYNDGKSFIDVSDQLASYCTTVRRGVKWYRKVLFELVTNTCIVNAHVLYKSTVLKPMDIVAFRENIVMYLLSERFNNIEAAPISNIHKIIFMKERRRGRCTLCYKMLVTRFGRKEASKKCPQVTSACPGCPEHKFMCVECFFRKHRTVTK